MRARLPTMFETHRLLCAALSLVITSAYAVSLEGRIFVDEKGNLQTPPVIQEALQGSFPGFQHWTASEYHEGLRYSTDSPDGRGVIAPYAIVLDLNGDGRDDLVLHGHDQHEHLLLCVISTKTGYAVQVVNRGTPIPTPAAIESWKDGRRDDGLNEVLSLPPADRKDWAFMINYLPETRMHREAPAAETHALGIGVMFSNGHCAVDHRDSLPDVH